MTSLLRSPVVRLPWSASTHNDNLDVLVAFLPLDGERGQRARLRKDDFFGADKTLPLRTEDLWLEVAVWQDDSSNLRVMQLCSRCVGDVFALDVVAFSQQKVAVPRGTAWLARCFIQDFLGWEQDHTTSGSQLRKLFQSLSSRSNSSTILALCCSDRQHSVRANCKTRSTATSKLRYRRPGNLDRIVRVGPWRAGVLCPVLFPRKVGQHIAMVVRRTPASPEPTVPFTLYDDAAGPTRPKKRARTWREIIEAG